jgi:hypothetical protein
MTADMYCSITTSDVLVIMLISFIVAGAGAFLGYVIGQGRGEDQGYQLGYHEGEFDAMTREDL